jgi:uncharacterized protein YegL
MKDNLTEIIFILDRSGSMQSLTEDTIGGFNSFIEKQKALPGNANLTTILFDDQYLVLHNGVDIQSVKLLTKKDYFARANTALLDAIGKTINTVGARLDMTPEDEKPSKVLFIITTDGEENASREFGHDQVKEMIELQTNTYNWEFMFLGADLSAVNYSTGLGISLQNSHYSAQSATGVNSVYTAMNMATACYRSVGVINTDWKEEIET